VEEREGREPRSGPSIGITEGKRDKKDVTKSESCHGNRENIFTPIHVGINNTHKQLGIPSSDFLLLLLLFPSLSLSLSSFIPFPSPISGSLIHYPISTPRPTDQQNHHSLLRDRSAFLDNIVIALFHVSIYLVNNCSWSWVLQKQIKSPNSILLKNNNPIGMTIMT
jgi:hypothetical protein